MARRWDTHDFDDPDENPVTRFRHLGGDYGPYDPAHWDFDDDDDDDDGIFAGWDSDASFSHIPQQVYDEFDKGIAILRRLRSSLYGTVSTQELQLACFAHTDDVPEQEKYPRNPKDEVKRTPGGPIMLLHDVDYFLPQWDEQLLGPEWRQKRGEWDYDNPPAPLPPNDPMLKDAFKYCAECGLTWLVGYDKVEGHRHPHHFAWQATAEHIDIHSWGLELEASIVVHVRGSVLPKGQPSTSPVCNPGSFGVFFGKDSKYNLAGPHGNIHSTQVDKERADIAAISNALVKIRYDIVEDRRKTLRKFEKSKGGDTNPGETSQDASKNPELTGQKLHEGSGGDDDEDWEDSSEEDNDDEDDDDDVSFRVIIVSDNKEVIDNICNLEEKQPTKHKEEYDRLDDLLDEFQDIDVIVKWYYVPDEFNKEAAELANESLEGRFRGYEEVYKPPKGRKRI